MSGFFAQFAHSWDNPDGPMLFLHRMQSARISFIRKALGSHPLTGLDLGCGIGLVSHKLAEMGHILDSVECEEELLEKARKIHADQATNIRWIASAAEDFSPTEPYDFIVCLEMLEHVDNPQSLCKKMISWLKPGGHLILSTLNRTNAAFFTAILGAEYICKILPRGTHDFEKFLTPEELNYFVDPLICQSIQGLIYNPFEKSFFLGQSLSINYIGHWKKPL